MSASMAKVTASLSEASNLWKEKLPATQEAAQQLWSRSNRDRYKAAWLVAASKSLENPYAAQIFVMAPKDAQDMLLRGYMVAGKVDEADLAQIPPLSTDQTNESHGFRRPHKSHDGMKSTRATSQVRSLSPDWPDHLDSP